MTLERPVRLARPTAGEWAEFNVVFRNNPDLIFIFEQLRIRNSLEMSKLPARRDMDWLKLVNSFLRRTRHPKLKRFRLSPSLDTIDKPKEKQIIHLYEIETGEARPRTV